MLKKFHPLIDRYVTKQNAPNLITFGRIGVVVLLALLIAFRPGFSLLIFWLFVIAAASDYADGYLARKWNAVSAFGAMMDQISDKLLVVLMLVYLVKYDVGGMIVLPSLAIILRELYVSGLREYMAGKHIAVPVSKSGKWKTAIQLIAIGAIQFGVAYGAPDIEAIGGLLLLIAAFLAIYSAAEYTKSVLPHVSGKK